MPATRFTKTSPASFPSIHEERMSVRIRPIKRQGRVGEPAIVPYLQPAKFTEIVQVKFEQVGQNRRVLGHRWDDLDM
jgi:hypothetical protein